MTHLAEANVSRPSPQQNAYRLVQIGLLIGGISLCSCSRMAQSDIGRVMLRGFGQVKSVEAIQAQEVAIDRAIYLTGTVGDRIPILDGQLYQLQDSTGSIWVVTSDQTLQAGDRLVIRGAVRFQEFSELEGAPGEFYIQELRQIEHTTADQRTSGDMAPDPP